MPNSQFLFSLLLSFSLLISGCNDKPLTGAELLDKSIAYHDPEGLWERFSGELNIVLEYADGQERNSWIRMNRPDNIFSILEEKNGKEILRYTDSDTSYILVNSEALLETDSTRKLGLTNERTVLFRDYYGYLYGLPMKLKDEGTIVHDVVDKVTFMEKEYLKLKVTYREDVGSDTWYFYFDPETYALETYQFFHEEEKNDGEYIILEGESQYKSLRIPKDRTWYTNDSSKLLGVDRLVEIL